MQAISKLLLGQKREFSSTLGYMYVYVPVEGEVEKRVASEEGDLRQGNSSVSFGDTPRRLLETRQTCQVVLSKANVASPTLHMYI